MKKFDGLGRSLTKLEQKKILGGTEEDDADGGGGGGCSLPLCYTNCVLSCGGQVITGRCVISEFNQRCYCVGAC
jgi:hypothetical protein